VKRLLSLAACLIAPALCAQPYDKPPPVGPPRPVVIAAPDVATLDNGLRVVVSQRRSLPLVTAELVIRSGTETDPRGLAGLADMTATLLAKGTAKRTAPQIADAAEALGGQLDTGAGWYRASVSMTVTRPQLAAALALIAEVALTPRFAQDELDRARKLTLNALAVALRDPGKLASFASDRAAFGEGTFGHPVGGTPGSVARIRRADVVAQHATYYRPDNATLILVGDIDPAQARTLAQSAFGAWKRPTTALPALRADDARPAPPAPIVIAMAGAGQAGVAMTAPSIARSAADYYPGVIANTLLGGGYSSRLNLEARIRRGLTYGIFSQLEARRQAGTWWIAAQTKNESAPELIAVVLEELRKVAVSLPPAEELEARKLTMIGSVSRSFETTESLAGTLASFEANGIPVVEVTSTIDRLSAVTPQQVVDFAKAHWKPEALAIVVAGEADKFESALRAVYPGLRVIAHDALDLDRATLTRK